MIQHACEDINGEERRRNEYYSLCQTGPPRDYAYALLALQNQLHPRLPDTEVMEIFKLGLKDHVKEGSSRVTQPPTELYQFIEYHKMTVSHGEGLPLTFRGNRYFRLIKDDASGMFFIRLMKTKDHVFDLLKDCRHRFTRFAWYKFLTPGNGMFPPIMPLFWNFRLHSINFSTLCSGRETFGWSTKGSKNKPKLGPSPLGMSHPLMILFPSSETITSSILLLLIGTGWNSPWLAKCC